MIQALKRQRPPRTGGTLGSLLLMLSILGTLTVTAAIVAPKYLAAEVGPPVVVEAHRISHQELIDELAALIGRSVRVLAIHPRGATPYVELVLWLFDDDDPGELDESELAILSHSRIMRTVTIYRLADDVPKPATISPDRLDETASPAFCERWRADLRVVPLILITGVSDLRVEPLEPTGQGSRRLRIGLTWARDSVDGADEASAVVDAAIAVDGS